MRANGITLVVSLESQDCRAAEAAIAEIVRVVLLDRTHHAAGAAIVGVDVGTLADCGPSVVYSAEELSALRDLAPTA